MNDYIRDPWLWIMALALLLSALCLGKLFTVVTGVAP